MRGPWTAWSPKLPTILLPVAAHLSKCKCAVGNHPKLRLQLHAYNRWSQLVETGTQDCAKLDMNCRQPISAHEDVFYRVMLCVICLSVICMCLMRVYCDKNS